LWAERNYQGSPKFLKLENLDDPVLRKALLIFEYAQYPLRLMPEDLTYWRWWMMCDKKVLFRSGGLEDQPYDKMMRLEQVESMYNMVKMIIDLDNEQLEILNRFNDVNAAADEQDMLAGQTPRWR
jgi:hypothetical protein